MSMTLKMAEILETVQLPVPGRQDFTSQTLLKGNATYKSDSDIHSLGEGASPDDRSSIHEVEVKVDRNGLISMDIYAPRTLINSIPIRGGVTPIGALDNFQVVPSNQRENVLCIIHQTSEGPKHEYLIFKKRDEVDQWMERLNIELFNRSRRLTYPKSNPLPNTKRLDKVSSACESCFSPLFPQENEVSLERKSPVEVEFPYDDDNFDDPQTLTADDTLGLMPPIYELGSDESTVAPQIEGICSNGEVGLNIESVTPLELPSCHFGERSPSISTISNAGEVSQRARKRQDIPTAFSQLRGEMCRSEVTVDISVTDACLIKMFDYQGHAWVRRSCTSSGLYGGDLVTTINGDKVTNTKTFRERVEQLGSDNQVVKLTIERLPHASLLLMRKLPSGEVSFTTEGTKVKLVDVESDEGLFSKVKEGSAYITNIDGHSISYSATTSQVSAHLQAAADEYFLVLHPIEFAEKLQ